MTRPAPEERLFAGNPERLRLFRAIRRRIQDLGPVNVTATKTQVAFGARRRFAWVWVPQMWTTNRPEDSVTLTWALDRKVVDPRIAEAVEARPGRWTHHLVIVAEADLDEAVLGWLREARELASRG